MSYLYAVTSQQPTAVNFSLVCNFTSAHEKNLVVVRSNRLEVHAFRDGSEADGSAQVGLVPLLNVPLFGRVKGIEAFRPPKATTDHLFVLIERKKFSILAYDAEQQRIVTKQICNVKERLGRDAEMGQRSFMDPDGRMIGMMLYDGLIKLLPFDAHGPKDTFNVTLEETRILDIKFLHGFAKPTLCVLHEDNRRGRHVKTFSVEVREKELSAGPWTQNNVEFGANLLIPVPAPLNGVIVVGLCSISYLSGTGNTQAIEISPSQITAWTRLDPAGTRYLLGDSRGTLLALTLCVEHGRVVSVCTDVIGKTSIAETLNYLDRGVLFVGSCLGDSQLVKLHAGINVNAGTDGANSAVEVLDVFPNIGPVLDMCLVENEAQGGQRQLVTCSGAYQDGSLRIIRSGIGIHEQASLEMDGVKKLFSLRPALSTSMSVSDSSSSSERELPFDKFLVQSFISETRVFAIENEEMGEHTIAGFDALRSTLYCGNLHGDLWVQVTPRALRLVDALTQELVQECAVSESAQRITVAAGNASQVVVALSGGEIQYWTLNASSRVLVCRERAMLDQDIACLSLQPAQTQTQVHTEAESALLTVGMWTDNTVRLLALPTLQEVSRVKLNTDTQVRDVLLVAFPSASAPNTNAASATTEKKKREREEDEEGEPRSPSTQSAQQQQCVYLLAGMGDGTLLTYTVDFSSGLPSLGTRKRGVLGTHPVTFRCFTSNDELCVFACCDRPSILYMRNDKLLFANVDTACKEITEMTSFHSELFPDCIAFASETSLHIGTIEDIQKIHIQSFPLNEAPRRIAHCAVSRCYAVCTERTTVSERGEEAVNRVLFFDDASMALIGEYELDPLEQALAVTAMVFEGQSAPHFVVGTAQVVNEELEPSRGRVLVFQIMSNAANANAMDVASSSSSSSAANAMDTEERRLQLVTERETKAGVYTLAAIEGRLAAGVGSKVQIYKFVVKDDPQRRKTTNTSAVSAYSSGHAELQSECSHQGHIMVLMLKAHKNLLLVGDLVRSVTLLHYRSAESVIEEVARDFNSNYMRACEFMDGAEDHVLGCDDQGNLFCARRQSEAKSEEEQSKLEIRGEFHLGDYVNVMRRGMLVSQPIESESSAGVDAASTAAGTASASATAPTAGTLDIFSAEYKSVTGFPTDRCSVLFATISGAIGSVLVLSEASYRFFSAVERAVKDVVNAVGNFPHEDWRNFQNEMRLGAQKHVIDGDLVETLLDLDAAQLELVTRKVNDDLGVFLQSVVSGATGSAANAGTGISSESASALLASLEGNRVALSTEEIVRRVEDISRLH